MGWTGGSSCVLLPCSTPLLLWLVLQLGKAKERKEKKPGGQEGLRQVFCAPVTSSQTAPAAGNEQLCHPAPQAIPNAWWPGRPLPHEAFLASCISKEGNTSGLGRPDHPESRCLWASTKFPRPSYFEFLGPNHQIS